MPFPSYLRLACNFKWRWNDKGLELWDRWCWVNLKGAHRHDQLHLLQSGWTGYGQLCKRYDYQTLETQQRTGIQVLQNTAGSRPRGFLRRVCQAQWRSFNVLLEGQYNQNLGFEHWVPSFNIAAAFRVGKKIDVIKRWIYDGICFKGWNSDNLEHG